MFDWTSWRETLFVEKFFERVHKERGERKSLSIIDRNLEQLREKWFENAETI